MHDAVASLIEGFGGEVLPEAAGLNEFLEEAYSVNGADLTAVGEAIAGKAGMEKPAFPDGWKEAVEGIGHGIVLKVKPTGGMYAEISSVTVPYMGLGGSHAAFCQECKSTGAEVFDAYGILEGYAPECVHCSGHYPFTNQGNPLLRKIVAPKLKKIDSSYWGRNLKALEFLQLGSIGNAVECLMSDGLGLRDTTAKLTIEIYVDAEKLADISTEITAHAPWSATEATIVYRNSTTGEVITE